jgi:hypothetical protein
LAGQSFVTIAKETSTLPETIRWCEALYYNVVEYLDQRDWIMSAVLLPPIANQLDGFLPTQESVEAATAVARHRRLNNVIPVALPFRDASVRYLAYFGGPVLVDIMLHGIQSGRPLRSQDDLARWLDATCSLTLKRRSLQAMSQVEINKFNALELITAHARIVEIEASDDAQESRRTGFERHVQAMIDDIPWRSGPPLKSGDADKDRYAEAPGELRDDELGTTVPSEDIWHTLPPPRARQGRPPTSDGQTDFV